MPDLGMPKPCIHPTGCERSISGRSNSFDRPLSPLLVRGDLLGINKQALNRQKHARVLDRSDWKMIRIVQIQPEHAFFWTDPAGKHVSPWSDPTEKRVVLDGTVCKACFVLNESDRTHMFVLAPEYGHQQVLLAAGAVHSISVTWAALIVVMMRMMMMMMMMRGPVEQTRFRLDFVKISSRFRVDYPRVPSVRRYSACCGCGCDWLWLWLRPWLPFRWRTPCVRRDAGRWDG